MWPCSALHRNSDKGVEIAFLGTRTGLSRTNLFVPADQLSNRWVPPLNISVIITYSSRCRCDCAWWIWSFTRHVSLIVCASSETSWQRRTRRVCLMLITSLCVQESGRAGPRHICLLHPLQHRYAEQKNTYKTWQQVCSMEIKFPGPAQSCWSTAAKLSALYIIQVTLNILSIIKCSIV